MIGGGVSLIRLYSEYKIHILNKMWATTFVILTRRSRTEKLKHYVIQTLSVELSYYLLHRRFTRIFFQLYNYSLNPFITHQKRVDRDWGVCKKYVEITCS